MLELSQKLKLDILKVLLSEKELFGTPNEDGSNIIKFLDDMLNLKGLPSEDSRYSNAYGDAYQHLVNNDDWEYDYVLTQRFNIVENTETFIDFLNRIIHPDVRNDEDDILRFYLLVNPLMEKEKLNYILTSYHDNGLPIYNIGLYDDNNIIPANIIENKIPFFIDNSPNGYNNDIDAHAKPNIFPCFVLVNNREWNDFFKFTNYFLFYYSSIDEHFSIGSVKIIHKEIENTPDILNKTFYNLDKNFCSLGVEYSYYENIKSLFGKVCNSMFWALKDSAIFSDILEEFENEYYFNNSLIRFDEQEQLLREAKYRLDDYDIKNLYSFRYYFKPKFSEESVLVNFDFDSKKTIPSRIFALIGKNGAGKTQLITTLPLDISKKNNGVFIPKTPLFSKVIAVSYSAFDTFEIPKKTADFNYVYCGLRDSKGEIYSEKGLKLRFHNSWKKIKAKNRFDKWLVLLPLFMEQELIDEFIVEDDNKWEYKVDIKGFGNVSKKLSSGQSILLYIITEIVANIRFDSLIIYDEPETHLHPNAISQLINTIYELTQEFQSYCIIATHSPLIVRELLSRNVFIMERESNVVTLRKPLIETFGENLTTITEDIFGNRDIPNQFEKILFRLAKSGKSFEDIISIIETENIPLSLNARIYLKSIINEEY